MPRCLPPPAAAGPARPERVRRALALALLLAAGSTAAAGELPSFLRAGDAFCSDETDFDRFASHAAQALPAQTSCDSMEAPVRVAVLGGTGGLKTLVRVLSGRHAYQVGWTDGTLPIVADPGGSP